MKLQFVRLSSVRVTNISEPNAQISFKFWLLLPLGHTLGQFLALLDYVSRAHEIEIHLSSVRRVAIISEPIARIS